MILDLLKFGLIFFLPTLIGRAFKLYREFKSIKISVFPWKQKSFYDILIHSIVLIYIVSKLTSIFVFDAENFFSRVSCRIDSPSYVMRNHYRTYVEQWAETNPEIAKIVKLHEHSSDNSGYEDSPLYRDFLNLQLLSEQLKSKEKKAFYSKFGETAFLQCDYCNNDYDYLMFLVPRALYEYSLFLALSGVLSSCVQKSNWRIYGIFSAMITLAMEAYGLFFSKSPDLTSFEPFDAIFGDDMFTLRFEKIMFMRNISFILFLLVAYLFNYEKDLKLELLLDQLRSSLGTSVDFLQSTRIQTAAITIDENLSKYANDASRLNKSKLAAIISDPNFRQKVAESGHKLNVEEMLEQKDKNIDELFEIIKK